jgi:copper(I)-binding protein
LRLPRSKECLRQTNHYRKGEIMGIRNVVLITAGLIAIPLAHAQVTIEKPWLRATVPGQTVAGAYMTLKSVKPAALIAVRTPLTRDAELHEMTMENGVMKMRPVSRLDLPAGKAVELKPGGYHLMLMNIARPLHAGETVPLTLVIEEKHGKREQVEVEAKVRDMTATGEHHGKMH